MHSFSKLTTRLVSFILPILKQHECKIRNDLQICSSTILIENLQLMRLQRVVTAVGMFAIFESVIQRRLPCESPFSEVQKHLIGNGELQLSQIFTNYVDAINVLKHGRGRSYNSLVDRASSLDFSIKLPDNDIFQEGDVSELSFLIEVDDTFVMRCADLIRSISISLSKLKPELSNSADSIS